MNNLSHQRPLYIGAKIRIRANGNGGSRDHGGVLFPTSKRQKALATNQTKPIATDASPSQAANRRANTFSPRKCTSPAGNPARNKGGTSGYFFTEGLPTVCERGGDVQRKAGKASIVARASVIVKQDRRKSHDPA